MSELFNLKTLLLHLTIKMSKWGQCWMFFVFSNCVEIFFFSLSFIESCFSTSSFRNVHFLLYVTPGKREGARVGTLLFLLRPWIPHTHCAALLHLPSCLVPFHLSIFTLGSCCPLKNRNKRALLNTKRHFGTASGRNPWVVALFLGSGRVERRRSSVTLPLPRSSIMTWRALTGTGNDCSSDPELLLINPPLQEAF